MNRCGPGEVVLSVLAECDASRLVLPLCRHPLASLPALDPGAPYGLIPHPPTALVVAPGGLGLQRARLLLVHVAGTAHVPDPVQRPSRRRRRMDEKTTRERIALPAAP